MAIGLFPNLTGKKKKKVGIIKQATNAKNAAMDELFGPAPAKPIVIKKKR